ncbi:MAG: ABC-2 transporter permease [bacterium]|nr:ABC-2 transporter permease [bacterium]
MKGLIRNNFYSVNSALKWSIAVCIILNIAVLIGVIHFPNINVFLPILMLAQMGAFVGLTGTALQKDNTSKWSKYERTLPVKISDMVMARYISFLIFSLIGMLLASITVVIFWVVSAQAVSVESVGFGYSFGIVFSLLVPALLYPLVLKFGADKSEILLMISVVIIMCLFAGGNGILAPFLYKLNNADMIYRVACVAISMAAFIASYFVSLAIYKRENNSI